MDTSFPHEYFAEWTEDLPSSERPYYFPGGHRAGGRDGLIVRVMPVEGRGWTGIFAFGDLSPKSVTGIFSSPRSEWLCVVAKGQGYWVYTKNPAQYEELPLDPILGVVVEPEQRVLILHDFVRLCALDENGARWQSPRLSWDGLRKVRVESEKVVGEAWSPEKGLWVPFEVDLESGFCKGGSFQPERGTR